MKRTSSTGGARWPIVIVPGDGIERGVSDDENAKDLADDLATAEGLIQLSEIPQWRNAPDGLAFAVAGGMPQEHGIGRHEMVVRDGPCIKGFQKAVAAALQTPGLTKLRIDISTLGVNKTERILASLLHGKQIETLQLDGLLKHREVLSERVARELLSYASESLIFGDGWFESYSHLLRLAWQNAGTGPRRIDLSANLPTDQISVSLPVHREELYEGGLRGRGVNQRRKLIGEIVQLIYRSKRLQVLHLRDCPLTEELLKSLVDAWQGTKTLIDLQVTFAAEDVARGLCICPSLVQRMDVLREARSGRQAGPLTMKPVDPVVPHGMRILAPPGSPPRAAQLSNPVEAGIVLSSGPVIERRVVQDDIWTVNVSGWGDHQWKELAQTLQGTSKLAGLAFHGLMDDGGIALPDEIVKALYRKPGLALQLQGASVDSCQSLFGALATRKVVLSKLKLSGRPAGTAQQKKEWLTVLCRVLMFSRDTLCKLTLRGFGFDPQEVAELRRAAGDPLPAITLRIE